jgi:serine/threonine protein kinase/tetratricopeptide (TPR) repeat protein
MSSKAPRQFVGNDRFEIRRRLGSGGMGVVYHVFDRERGAELALKTVERLTPRAIYDLKREFRSLADIRHPNLVALQELVFTGGQWFFTMELVQGVDFLTYVWDGFDRTVANADTAPLFGDRPSEPRHDPDKPWSPVWSEERLKRLRSVLRQLAEGLAALHGAGKLHRDIKPSNVLVTPEERVVLLDFGLVAEHGWGVDKISMESMLVGTAEYMSPDQATTVALTPATDWYGVGVMLYEALTGRLPFEGSVVEILRLKQLYDPAPPRTLCAGIPEDLDGLCVDLLRRRPERRPAAEEVLRRLGGPGARAARTTHPPVSFVGRQAELNALREAFEVMRQGKACTVHITGGSGIGKTHLVQRFLGEVVEGEQAVVLTGRCYERESVPYKTLDAFVDALSRYLAQLPSEDLLPLLPRDVLALARVFPVLLRVEPVALYPRRRLEQRNPQEVRRNASKAFRELLGRLAFRKNVVMHLDDLQWGDVDSAALLSDVLTGPEPPPVLLLASYRSEDVQRSPFLQALRSAPTGQVHVKLLELEPLSEAETKELAKALALNDPSILSAVDALVEESAGNLYFLRELVHDFIAGGPLTKLLPGKVTLEEVIRRRVARIDEQGRALLEVIAVARGPISQRVALKAAGQSEKATSLLHDLRVHHLVHTRGTRGQDDVDCYHDRIRGTVVAGLTPERLQDCHLRLALALSAADEGDPETLAHHFHGAGELEKAAECAEEAAEEAAQALAFDRAARLYRFALELPQRDEEEARKLWIQLADGLANVGRGAEAAEAYFKAAEGASAAENLDLRRRGAEQLLWSGRLDDGLKALREVLETAGLPYPATPRRAIASLLWNRFRLRLRRKKQHFRDASQVPLEELIRIDLCMSLATGVGFVDPVRGAALQAKHQVLALRSGEPFRVALALSTEAIYVAMRGWRSKRTTEAVLARAKELAEQVRLPEVEGTALVGATISSYLLGQWEECLEAAGKAEELLRYAKGGATWQLNEVQLFALWARFYLGSVRRLVQVAPVMLNDAKECGNLHLAASLLTGTAAVWWLVDDNPDGAVAGVEEAKERWSYRGYPLHNYDHLYSLGQVELYRGEGAAALARLKEAWGGMKESYIFALQMVRIEAMHLRGRCALQAAAAARDPGEARRLLDEARACAKRIERERTPWATPLARLLQAGLAHRAEGPSERVVELLGEAESGFVLAQMRLYAMAARHRRGEIVRGNEGRSLVAIAREFMEDQRVKNPERMTEMLAPGFGEGTS